MPCQPTCDQKHDVDRFSIYRPVCLLIARPSVNKFAVVAGRLTSTLVHQCDTNNQIMSSWIGFNILTRNNISVSKAIVGYLPTIHGPATSMSTVYEVLCQVQNITKPYCCDQALYAKAAEVIWKQPQQFSQIVLHSICTS